MKNPTTIKNETISETISEILCGKKVIYSNDITQTSNTIFAKNYFWILHEIGHYIACEEQYRNCDNLSLPMLPNDNDSYSYREVTEEYCAVIIANHLYFNYINDDINEYKVKMHLTIDATTHQLQSERFVKYNINKNELDIKCAEEIRKIDHILNKNGIGKNKSY